MKSKKNLKRFGEGNVEIYQLKLGKFKLESDNLDVFTIRMHELDSLTIRDFPYDHKFIFCDTSTFLINIRSIVEKLDEESIMLTIEETSKFDGWKSLNSVNEYYISRKEMLFRRQKDLFDLIVNEAFINDTFFLLEYKSIINDNRFMKATLYTRTILETVNLAVKNFNI